MSNPGLSKEQILMVKRFEIFTNDIAIIHKNIQRLKTEVMKTCGLKGDHGIYLSYLILYRDGLTVSKLAEITGADKAAVSRAYAALYKKGYIEYPDFHGEKKYNTPAIATREAKKMMIPIIKEISKLIDRISLSDIEEDNRTIMYRTIKTITANVLKCVKDVQ